MPVQPGGLATQFLKAVVVSKIAALATAASARTTTVRKSVAAGIARPVVQRGDEKVARLSFEFSEI